VSSGGIDFSAYHDPKTFAENRDIWERALNKMKAGEMPPAGLSKPPDMPAIVSWLQTEFNRQDANVKADAGRIAARQLNRAEYNNTVRDLLGIDIRPADSLPQDPTAYGFDNISDALNMSSVLLEKYADAAERSVRTAIFGPEKLKPAMTHYPFPVRLNDSRGTKPKIPDAEHYDLTGLSSPHSAHAMHRFPVDGVYSFRIVTNGHRPNQSMPAQVALWIDSKMVHSFEVDATDLEGQVLEAKTKVTPGDHLISLSYLKEFHGLPPSYGGPEPSTRPAVALINPRGKLTEKDIETLRKFGTRIKTDSVETRVDNRFESLDVGGPFDQSNEPSQESLKRVFVCGHTNGKHNASCPRLIIASFAQRAFRRPLQPKEAEPFLNLYTLARKHGDGFNEGIAAALEGIMVSPNFLYRIEHDQPAPPGANAEPVSDYELASRLSYFIWSSMPDEQLLHVAKEHLLRDQAVLAEQVRRMLRDEKARALVDNFGGQWLQFRNIDVLHPDNQRFIDFDESLRHSVRRETELFLENLIRSDRSLLELLDANYTFVDERLARFYGIKGVSGPEFQKVDVSNTERGGGLLSQASILTISSYSTRTSPVLRGKWILENILDAPPPPPPPSVPALDDSKVGQSASLRQQMEEHRKNAVCASCHAKMDPLGFGLENLNAIGAWRDMDGKIPVDASGSLPDGRSFRGPKELKALLLADKNRFVSCISEKMLTYALGRGLERYDRPALHAIEARVAEHDYRFSELVIGIAESLPFQMKRPRDTKMLASTSGGTSKQ
jgi:hypothetical protein